MTNYHQALEFLVALKDAWYAWSLRWSVALAAAAMALVLSSFIVAWFEQGAVDILIAASILTILLTLGFVFLPATLCALPVIGVPLLAWHVVQRWAAEGSTTKEEEN